MNSSNPQPSEPSSVGKVLRAIVRTILTLILVVFIIAALGVAGYYGIVYVHNEAVVPAQNAHASVMDLSTRQAQANQGLAQISARLDQMAASRSQDTAKIDSLAGNVTELQDAIQKQNLTLNRLDNLESNLNDLSARMDTNSIAADGMQTTLAASDLYFQDLQTQVKLLQAMELLNRSRLYLIQSNYGLARNDVDSARQILVALQPVLPSYQQDAVALWVQRLTLVMGNLPNYPLLAGDDLEVAWGMLAGGLPPQITDTPTPYITPTGMTPTSYFGAPGSQNITPSYTPYIEITPTFTPTPYITPSSTPFFTPKPYILPSVTPYYTPTPTPTSSKTPFVTGS
jgi:hypothetical protein